MSERGAPPVPVRRAGGSAGMSVGPKVPPKRMAGSPVVARRSAGAVGPPVRGYGATGPPVPKRPARPSIGPGRTGAPKVPPKGARGPGGAAAPERLSPKRGPGMPGPKRGPGSPGPKRVGAGGTPAARIAAGSGGPVLNRSGDGIPGRFAPPVGRVPSMGESNAAPLRRGPPGRRGATPPPQRKSTTGPPVMPRPASSTTGPPVMPRPASSPLSDAQGRSQSEPEPVSEPHPDGGPAVARSVTSGLRKSLKVAKTFGAKTAKGAAKGARAASEKTAEAAQNAKKLAADRVCPGCTKAFVDTAKVKIRVNGRIYHRECISCGVCSLPFAEEFTYTDDGQPIHTECATGGTGASKQNRCKKCGMLFEKKVARVKAGDYYYHQSCFLCVHCSKPFTTAFTTQQNEPYHVDCWEEVQQARINTPLKRLETFVVRCRRCKKPFEPGEAKMQALDKVWHKHCFVCQRCDNPFSGEFGKEFTQRAKRPYHPACASAYDEDEASAKLQREEAKRLKQLEKEALASQKRVQREQRRAQQAVANANKKLRSTGTAISWHGGRAAAISDQISAGGDGLLTIFRGDAVVVLNLNVARDDERVPASLWPASSQKAGEGPQQVVLEGYASGNVGFVRTDSLDLAPSQQQLQRLESDKDAVLATREYDLLWDALAEPSLVVARSLCAVVPAEDMQAAAKIMLSTLLKVPDQHGATLLDSLLRSLAKRDVSNSQDQSTLFRTNSVATHILNEHFKIFGSDYLRILMRPLWRAVSKLVEEFGDVQSCLEVDPSKLSPVDSAMQSIASSAETLTRWSDGASDGASQRHDPGAALKIGQIGDDDTDADDADGEINDDLNAIREMLSDSEESGDETAPPIYDLTPHGTLDFEDESDGDSSGEIFDTISAMGRTETDGSDDSDQVTEADGATEAQSTTSTISLDNTSSLDAREAALAEKEAALAAKIAAKRAFKSVGAIPVRNSVAIVPQTKPTGSHFLGGHRSANGDENVSDASIGTIGPELGESGTIADVAIGPNAERLKQICEDFLEDITNSADSVPPQLLRCCSMLADVVESGGYSDAAHTVISGYFFLRAMTPSIANPDGFKLLEPTDSVDMQKSRRAFVLVSKVLQSVANGKEFREEYMAPLNVVVTAYTPRLRTFMDQLIAGGRSELEPTAAFSEPGEIDIFAAQRFYRVTTQHLARIVRLADSELDAESLSPEVNPIESFLEALAIIGPAF